MYSIYKRGGYPQPPTLPVGTQYCPVPTVPGTLSYKNLTESARIQEQQCTTMYISNAPVPVQRGDSNTVPYVNVSPTPASATTASIQNAVLFAGNNPYNPATRFSQYRFSNTVIPPPPPCPVAVPNPGYITPCIPPSMFRGSVENVGPT
jgi:hypothetical protein